MLILYTQTGCPFCDMVRLVIERSGAKFEERNIADEKYLSELLDKGGKRQVPFLIDEERGISMYESSDIIAYVKKEYR